MLFQDLKTNYDTLEKSIDLHKEKLEELPRFLDGENIPQIVFEAEVSGVLEIIRKVRNIIKLLNVAKN